MANPKSRRPTTAPQTTGVQIPAPAGNVAIRILMDLPNPMAGIPGMPATLGTRTECGYCHEDLDAIARRAKTTVKLVERCPKCRSKLMDAKEIMCYQCGSSMGDHGNCLRCPASASDAPRKKIMVIKVRLANPNMTDYTMIAAMAGVLEANPAVVTEAETEAQRDNWIQRVEEGALLPFGGSPEATTSRLAPPPPPSGATAGWPAAQPVVTVGGGDDEEFCISCHLSRREHESGDAPRCGGGGYYRRR